MNQEMPNQMGSDMQGEGGSPLDSIIARVESYIKDPRLATPATLGELKMDLEDLKSYMDKEETPEGEGADKTSEEPSDTGGHGGIAIMIGKMRGKK